MPTYPKEVDGMNVVNAADDLLYRMSVEFPKEFEVIESHYGSESAYWGAYARVAFGGSVFKVSIVPEGPKGREGPDRD